MLQLSPELPFWHEPSAQLCFAFLVIDYTPDHDLLWVCKMQNSGEIWCVANKELRAVENISLGRLRPCKD